MTPVRSRARRQVVCSVAVLLACSTATSACGRKRDTVATEVRAAMARTLREPRALVYTEVTGDRRVEVRAEVEDDLRYRSLLALDATPAFEEVVVDDALADRVLDARALSLLARPAGQGGGGPAPAAGTWVLDKYGAPTVNGFLSGGSRATEAVGDDPIIDSLTVFRYVDAALTAAGGAKRFDPDDLEYRPQEDPFPRPKKGVQRFDLLRPRLPRPEEAVASGARAVPAPANFRNLSLYVRDGKVIQVLEQIQVATRLRELNRLYNLGIPQGATRAEAAVAAVARINAVRAATGGEPLRLRSMSLVLEPGRTVDVDLPSDVVEGSLAGLRNRGELPRQERRA